jgi:hypothetical protein
MATENDCQKIEECLEKLLNNSGGFQIGGNTVAGLITAGAAIATGQPWLAVGGALAGGVFGDAVAGGGGGQSFNFDSLKRANLSDIYGNIIGGQDLREQIEKNPLIANDAVRLIVEGLRHDSDSVDLMYTAILGTSGVTDVSLIEKTLEFAQNEPIGEQEGQMTRLIEEYGLSLVQSQAIWFASALKSGRVQEFLQDTNLTGIIAEEFSVFMFQDHEGINLESERRQLLIDSALWKHPQSPEEFWEMENLLDSEELSNYLLTLQNPAFLPQYSDPEQSAILSSIMEIEDQDQKLDLVRLYAEGGWAIEATLGDDEARTFEGDNEEALHQAFIDNPELIRSPALANLFASDELKESFANMMLSVNEDAETAFGDRVSGLLSEAVDSAVSSRLEQYGIVLPEIEGEYPAMGSTELLERYMMMNNVWGADDLGTSIPIDMYRSAILGLTDLQGPAGAEVYPISLFSYHAQQTALNPGFMHIPGENPDEVFAGYDQQLREAVGAGQPVDGETGQSINVADIKSQIKEELDITAYIKKSDVKTMIDDAIAGIEHPESDCDCGDDDSPVIPPRSDEQMRNGLGH